jgi:AraC family transcriptional regulator of adaptative response / DNA-3-methyladenine glycosylase II
VAADGMIEGMQTMTAPRDQGIWRDTERCYRAVSSRDTRFDGQFITAVRTTGIYCRPSCPAVTPKRENVRFYPTAAAAQTNGFRACRRCLPDAVPGSPEWNIRADLAGRAMRLISDGVIERDGVPGLAANLGYSERQLGRVLTSELGAGPLALARAHRAHSARLLIELSDLSFSDVAFAAGFASIRQFNDTVREVFATTPTQLRALAKKRQPRRKDTSKGQESAHATGLSLRLPLRTPFDGEGLLEFLATRCITGVEKVSEHDGALATYERTIQLPHGAALVELSPAADHVRCNVKLTDVRDLGSAVSRVRRLLDLDADPQAIDQVLSADSSLAPLVSKVPGIRVPGTLDPHELVMRAILGQQVSVAAARNAAGRLAEALGERIRITETANSSPSILFPSMASIAENGWEILRGPKKRIETVCSVAAALAQDEPAVNIGRDADELRNDLLALPGIGPWTADYIVMRVLNSPDILLTGDLALRKGAANLGIETPSALLERSRTWRPWSSYAGMHLWRASHQGSQ